MFKSALRESNPPRQVGGLEPLPLGQGHSIFSTTAFALHPRYRSAGSVASGRRESRTLKAYRSTAFEAAAVANRLALPFLAAEAGIEPASRRLTVAFPYQHRTHRIVVFSQDGWI